MFPVVCSGLLCDTLSTSLQLTDDPIVAEFQTSLTYTGNALVINAFRSATSTFNLIMAIAGGDEVFKVTGTGEVGWTDF